MCVCVHLPDSEKLANRFFLLVTLLLLAMGGGDGIEGMEFLLTRRGGTDRGASPGAVIGVHPPQLSGVSSAAGFVGEYSNCSCRFIICWSRFLV